ncbi:MAG: hypothetical protein KIT58_04575 [Planctomycetota bacterium]|nr:hypothetical protein [Planctomycetota bacterium]
MYEVVGFLMVLAAATLGVAVAARRLDHDLGRLLWLSYVMRVIGSLARYAVLVGPYRGQGDATVYFNMGWEYADAVWTLDFEGIDRRTGQQGTVFIRIVSAIVLSIIGPTMLGEFLVFAMASLSGLWLMVLAMARETSALNTRRYALIVALAPSLWYWPSSIGKDSLILLALGLVVFGYAGRAGRVNWIALLLGLALGYSIRPHVAAIMGLGLVSAEILSGEGPALGANRLVKLTVVGVMAVVLLQNMGERFGLDALDLEDLQSFMDHAAGQTMQGGSRIESTSGLWRFPVGLMNVLFRPFPWEAHNLGALMASIELVVIWAYILRTRSRLRDTLTLIRHERALRFAVPCGLLFALALGATFFNLGILARQRVAPIALLLMCVWRSPQANPQPNLAHVSRRR